MSYDPHPFIKQVFKDSDGDLDGAWASYKSQFALRSPQDRVNDLYGWDQKLEEEHQLSPQHADLLSRVRELRGIHSALRSAKR